MSSIIDERGDQLSPAQVNDEGLSTFDLDEIAGGNSPEEILEQLEEEAYQAWEYEQLYSQYVPTFPQFLREYLQSL